MTMFLSKYPIIGYASSLGGSILLFMQNVLLPLQIIGATVGIAVGVITLYLKWLELKDRNKK